MNKDTEKLPQWCGAAAPWLARADDQIYPHRHPYPFTIHTFGLQTANEWSFFGATDAGATNLCVLYTGADYVRPAQKALNNHEAVPIEIRLDSTYDQWVCRAIGTVYSIEDASGDYNPYRVFVDFELSDFQINPSTIQEINPPIFKSTDLTQAEINKLLVEISYRERHGSRQNCSVPVAVLKKLLTVYAKAVESQDLNTPDWTDELAETKRFFTEKIYDALRVPPELIGGTASAKSFSKRAGYVEEPGEYTRPVTEPVVQPVPVDTSADLALAAERREQIEAAKAQLLGFAPGDVLYLAAKRNRS